VEIRTRIDGEEMHVELEGRLDAAWSGTVGKTLQDSLHAGCHAIALDLSKVSYLSSAGIRVLLLLAKQLKGVGGRLRILDPSPAVHNVLNLVGFHLLVEDGGAPPPQPAPVRAAPASSEPRSWQAGEHGFEIYDLNPAATMRGIPVGDPEAALAPHVESCRPVSLHVPAGTLAVGLGALGSEADCTARAGELLAVDGLAIALPGDDPAHPDWLVREGEMVPEVSLLYGLQAVGTFRHLLRFGARPEAPAVRLGELAEAALEVCRSEAIAFVSVAETAILVGAALQVPPGRAASGEWFAFPAIRDRLLFTAEPAFADETCLIAGIVAREPAAPWSGWLRPMGARSRLSAHLHAAVVPYRPVHKGLINLRDALDALIESQTVRGVLHLLNDDREGVGAGESFLRRGALWCAPVHFDGEVAV
jgi:anti-anti-sigma factor